MDLAFPSLPGFAALTSTDTRDYKIFVVVKSSGDVKGILVVTADLDLHVALERGGLDALNFNYVRPIGWS